MRWRPIVPPLPPHVAVGTGQLAPVFLNPFSVEVGTKEERLSKPSTRRPSNSEAVDTVCDAEEVSVYGEAAVHAELHMRP